MGIIRRDELARRQVERVSLGGKASAPKPREKTPEEKQREAEEALRRKAEETLSAAREQGQREGYAAGSAEGLASVREVLASVRELARRLEEERAMLAGRMEKDMMELLLAIADKMFFNVRENDRDRLSAVVKKAVSMLAHKETVTVRLHPDDLAILEPMKGDLAAATDDGSIAFMADPEITSGDCRVISPSGIVEANKQAFRAALEEQFNALTGTGEDEQR